jgi:hypothetical protein
MLPEPLPRVVRMKSFDWSGEKLAAVATSVGSEKIRSTGAVLLVEL